MANCVPISHNKIAPLTSHNNAESHPQRSFEDVASSGVFVDSVRMVIGYVVMFLYAMVMLSRFNVVEQGRERLTPCRFFAPIHNLRTDAF